MVRFVQISFKFHEHVICSPFESWTYLNMELNILITVLCMRMYDSQGSKDFASFLSTINVYLREKATI